MRPLALAVALLAVPALAQSTPDAPEALPQPAAAPDLAVADIDPALIGAWQLAEVVDAGRLGELDVAVEAMTCAFAADGMARVSMEIVQDLDPIASARAFAFDTEGGRIVVPDDEDVTYRLLDDGRLELETEGGLIVRLVRTGA